MAPRTRNARTQDDEPQEQPQPAMRETRKRKTIAASAGLEQPPTASTSRLPVDTPSTKRRRTTSTATSSTQAENRAMAAEEQDVDAHAVVTRQVVHFESQHEGAASSPVASTTHITPFLRRMTVKRRASAPPLDLLGDDTSKRIETTSRTSLPAALPNEDCDHLFVLEERDFAPLREVLKGRIERRKRAQDVLDTDMLVLDKQCQRRHSRLAAETNGLDEHVGGADQRQSVVVNVAGEEPLELASSQTETQSKQMSSLRQEVLGKTALSQTLANQIQGLLDHLADAEIRKAKLEKCFAKLDRQNESQTRALAEVQIQLKAYQEQANELIGLGSQYGALEEKTAALQQENDEMTTNMARLTTALNDHRAEEQRLQGLITRMEKEYAKDVANMTREREKVSREMEDQLHKALKGGKEKVRECAQEIVEQLRNADFEERVREREKVKRSCGIVEQRLLALGVESIDDLRQSLSELRKAHEASLQAHKHNNIKRRQQRDAIVAQEIARREVSDSYVKRLSADNAYLRSMVTARDIEATHLRASLVTHLNKIKDLETKVALRQSNRGRAAVRAARVKRSSRNYRDSGIGVEDGSDEDEVQGEEEDEEVEEGSEEDEAESGEEVVESGDEEVESGDEDEEMEEVEEVEEDEEVVDYEEVVGCEEVEEDEDVDAVEYPSTDEYAETESVADGP